MGFYLEEDVIKSIDDPSSGEPKKDLATKINETAEKEAIESCGPKSHEVVAILQRLCPSPNLLHKWSYPGDDEKEVRMEVAYTPSWREYGVSVFFDASASQAAKELTLSYTEDGALRSCFWTETTPTETGPVSVSAANLVPNAERDVEEGARLMALNYVREAHERGLYMGFEEGKGPSQDPPNPTPIRK